VLAVPHPEHAIKKDIHTAILAQVDTVQVVHMVIVQQPQKFAVVVQLQEPVIHAIRLRLAHPLHLIIAHIMTLVMETVVKMVPSNLAILVVAVADVAQAVAHLHQEAHRLKKTTTTGAVIVIVTIPDVMLRQVNLVPTTQHTPDVQELMYSSNVLVLIIQALSTMI